MHEYLAECLANETDLQSSLTEKIYELPKISCRKLQKSKKDCKNVLTAYLYCAIILVSKGEYMKQFTTSQKAAILIYLIASKENEQQLEKEIGKEDATIIITNRDRYYSMLKGDAK